MTTKIVSSQKGIHKRTKSKDIHSDNKSSYHLTSCSDFDNRSLNQAIIKEVDTDDEEIFPRKQHHAHSNSETKLRRKKNKLHPFLRIDKEN